MIILHSENSKLSRDFVSQDLTGYTVVDWESGGDKYLESGLPSPSNFPSVVYLLPAASGSYEQEDREGNKVQVDFSYPETYYVVTAPGSLKDAEAERDKAIAAKQSGQNLGQELPKVPDVEAFNLAVLANPASMQYLLTMSNALDLLNRYIVTRPQLLIPYWETLKVKEKLDTDYVQFVEDKAREFNIPIVEL